MSKDVHTHSLTASHGRSRLPAAGHADEDPPIRILRLPVVMSRVGLSRSTIYSRIRRGTFPKPISLGEHAKGWVEHEINALLRAAMERRQAQ
jgi:prophage regulatory protein